MKNVAKESILDLLKEVNYKCLTVITIFTSNSRLFIPLSTPKLTGLQHSLCIFMSQLVSFLRQL